jgi:RNA polymerase sigma factor (sigma-70 family)
MNTKEDTAVFLQNINACEGILQKICRLYFDNASDREDIYQDILLNAWKSYPNFKGQAKFSTWLYQVAINTAMNGLKKRKKQQYAPIATIPFVVEESTSNEQKENLTFLYKALYQLEELDRTIAWLYLDQLSYKEIGIITGLTEVNIGVRINRVKEKLKKILLQYGVR